MINRLPKEFRVDTTNGKHRPRVATAAGDLRKRFLTNAAQCIGSRPIAALSTAFLAGLVIGRLVKR